MKMKSEGAEYTDVQWSLQAVAGVVQTEAGAGERGPEAGTGSRWGFLIPYGPKG